MEEIKLFILIGAICYVAIYPMIPVKDKKPTIFIKNY